MSKKVLILIVAVVTLLFGWIFWYSILNKQIQMIEKDETEQSRQIESTEKEQKEEKKNQTDKPKFNKQKYSITEPSSIWVVVNKQNPLPTNYVPPDLIVPPVPLRIARTNEQMQIRAVVRDDLVAMFESATRDGIRLVFGSGYRSAAMQSQFYNSYVTRDGRSAADRYSARPGHSEHQTGLAVDITTPGLNCHLEICFEDTPQGKWLAQNAHNYGFVIRYQRGNENITGYQYEPWHLRYVGNELASELNRTSQTMEKFFGLGAAPDYR